MFRAWRKAEYNLPDYAMQMLKWKSGILRERQKLYSEQTLQRQGQDRKCKASTRASETIVSRYHVSGYIAPRVLHFSAFIINPRRTCAARVTVLGLCVCVCVLCDWGRNMREGDGERK